MLLERPGELITREELRRKLWEEDTFVDYERGLNVAVKKLRETLGDSAQSPRFVETLARRGYRFVASVDHINGTITGEPASKIESLTDSEVRLAPREAAVQRRNRKLPSMFLLLGAVLPVILGSVIWIQYFRDVPDRSISSMKTYPLTSFVGDEFDPALSPDSNQIAYVWRGEKDGNADIHVQLVGTGRPLPLTTDPADDLAPAWSPDGRYLAFVRISKESAGFYLTPSLGGPERKLADSHPFLAPHNLDWSPDGKFLAIADQPSESEPPSIFLLSVANGERFRLTSPPAPYSADVQPVFSPDGKTLAFTRTIGFSSGDIYLLSLAGGEPKRLTSDSSSWEPRWTPDGNELVFSSTRGGLQSLWRISISGGESKQVVAVGHGLSQPSLPRRGHRLAYVEHIDDTNVWEIEGPREKQKRHEARALISSTRRDDSPDFSPNGNKVIFASTRSGNYELWMCDRDGSNPRQMTFFGEGVTGSARWSPDGRSIVFDSQRGDQTGIYVMSAEGGEARRLPTGSAADFVPSWSRDGRWIYFCSTRTGNFQIWKIPLAGGQATQVTKKGGYNSIESLDGKFLYHERECSAKSFVNTEIWRLSLETGEDTLVLGQAGVERYWALAKEGIYFITLGPAHPGINFFSFGTNQVMRLVNLEKQPLPPLPGLVLSPDGKCFLYAQLDQSGSDIMLAENFR